jgi:hypothetical protein
MSVEVVLRIQYMAYINHFCCFVSEECDFGSYHLTWSTLRRAGNSPILVAEMLLNRAATPKLTEYTKY